MGNWYFTENKKESTCLPGRNHNPSVNDPLLDPNKFRGTHKEHCHRQRSNFVVKGPKKKLLSGIVSAFGNRMKNFMQKEPSAPEAIVSTPGTDDPNDTIDFGPTKQSTVDLYKKKMKGMFTLW